MKPTEIRTIWKKRDGSAVELDDELITEYEPDLWINGEKICSLLCTPLDLEELITGYLLTSGKISGVEQIKDILIEEGRISVKLEQAQWISVPGQGIPPWNQEEVLQIGREVFAGYELFCRTGGTHAAAIVKDGEIVCRFEDIGRHNAIDKAVGWMFRAGIAPEACQLYTSGRVTTAILEKAVNTGIRMIVSHAAVTAQAADEARREKMVLLGFCRENRYNQYA